MIIHGGVVDLLVEISSVLEIHSAPTGLDIAANLRILSGFVVIDFHGDLLCSLMRSGWFGLIRFLRLSPLESFVLFFALVPS